MKMTSELLQKESDFYRENEILENRSKKLLSKVNNMMKEQETFIQEAIKENIEFHNPRKTNCDVNDKTFNLTIKELEDLRLPSSVNDMGTKGLNHFLRAKLKSLTVENQRLDTDCKKKTEEMKKLQKENQTLTEEKEKWFASSCSNKNTISKLENQNSFLNSKLQARDGEYVVLKKEVDQLKKELKTVNLTLNSTEVRLNRMCEENEKLKTSLKIAKDEEKEFKDTHRKQINELTSTLKLIEKHKMELINGFKKQMQLIDNLKTQKMLLGALKTVELNENEYLKILDQQLE